MEDVRIKLAATWIAAMFGYIYGDIFGFYIPGWIEKIIAGDVPVGSPITLLGAAILMTLPGLMVFLSVTLPYKPTRWANIIMGIFHIVVMLWSFSLPPLDIYYVYLGIVEMAFNALAIWYAWTWTT
jgi:hypothetical protein